MKMKIYPIKLYIIDRFNLFVLIPSAILIIIGAIWLFWQTKPQDDYIFLHYNILFGVDLVGEWWKIIHLPITALIIFIINFIISWFIFSRDKFASRLINAVNLYCQIFIFIAILLIVFLNV